MSSGNYYDEKTLKLPDGIYITDNYYQYPTGEKAFQDGTVEPPNGMH